MYLRSESQRQGMQSFGFFSNPQRTPQIALVGMVFNFLSKQKKKSQQVGLMSTNQQQKIVLGSQGIFVHGCH